VLPSRRSDADLLRLFCRTELLRSDPLAEATALDSGTALTNAALPAIAVANRMMDAAIAPGFSPELTLAEVSAHFASRGVACWEWWLNFSQPSEPLAATLVLAGWMPRQIEVLALPAPSRPSDRPGPGISVYPARAALGQARMLAEEMAAGHSQPAQFADAVLLQLDDPHYELLLAAVAGTPIGMIGLLAAGDLGRIDSLFVRPGHRDRGIDRLLLDRAIELAARSRFADVLVGLRRVGVLAHHSPIDAMVGEYTHPTVFRAAGFRAIGSLTIYASRS
jgi:GNAT superfamily N-acetyltransferase